MSGEFKKAAPAPEGGSVTEGELRDAITLILPMAKGYAAANPVGSNQAYVDYVENLIATREEAQEEAGEAIERLTKLAEINGSCPGWIVVNQNDLRVALPALRAQPQAREGEGE